MSDIPAVNDPLTQHQGAGVWGDPSADDGRPAFLHPDRFDYSAGMFTKLPDQDANAQAASEHPGLLAVRSDYIDQATYVGPHEATHRRYEPPFIVPVNQAAAGFTLLAPPTSGLHYIKLLGAFLTLGAAGTLRFVQGSMDGLNVAPLSGNFAMGGAATPALLLPTVDPPNPHLFTASDQALGIFTVTGLAQGWVICCNAPYDA